MAESWTLLMLMVLWSTCQAPDTQGTERFTRDRIQRGPNASPATEHVACEGADLEGDLNICQASHREGNRCLAINRNLLLMVMMVIVSGERDEKEDEGTEPLTPVRPCPSWAEVRCSVPSSCASSSLSSPS